MQKPSTYPSSDLLIVGAGAAGLSLALRCPPECHVTLLCKGQLQGGSTAWAQGGIASVTRPEDSIEQHVADTCATGAGLCQTQVVQQFVALGPTLMVWLAELGMPFATTTHPDQAWHTTQEAGHQMPRILHSHDATGHALSQTLARAVRARPRTTLIEHTTAIDLIRNPQGECIGCYALNAEQTKVHRHLARNTVLATGGASKVYLYTSNPDGASGDGIAMAARAGAAIQGMAFNQFHPTCLYHPQAKSFLISEALRGEGAHLLRPDGSRFAQAFDSRGELAPRDILARAIDFEMKRLGLDHVLLDISHRESAWLKQRFPTIYATCLRYGIDITNQAIPVVPAAHYTCGGVQATAAGQTSLPGLYALGETAHTGFHGANRLASNSLLECLAMAHLAGQTLQETWADRPRPNAKDVRPWDASRVVPSEEQVIVQHDWQALRRMMWHYVGIVRSNKRLQLAKQRIHALQQAIDHFYSQFAVTQDTIECRNLVHVAALMIEDALAQTKNVGLHYNIDLSQQSSRANRPGTASLI